VGPDQVTTLSCAFAHRQTHQHGVTGDDEDLLIDAPLRGGFQMRIFGRFACARPTPSAWPSASTPSPTSR